MHNGAMDTQDLQAFISVVDQGGFSAAAEDLHLTQPAISKRIANLENRLGQRLFDRIGRRISLTDAGQLLLPYARRSLEQLEDGRRALSHLDQSVRGNLAVGTSHHIGLHRLPPALRQFTRDFPQVNLDLHFMDSEQACDAVLAGTLELGIVTLPAQPIAQLRQRLIWPDPLSIVVGNGHPWAARPQLEIQELAELPAVLPDSGTYTHRIVRAALAAHGVEPEVRLATNYLETLKMLVVTGLGWSVLPDSMLDQQLRAVPVRGLRIRRELGLVWHQKRTLSSACKQLINIITS